MIYKGRFKNFKSINEIEFNLKPLTIFTGPNSSGKSNILEALSFFGQVSRLSDVNTVVGYETVFRQGIKKYPRDLENYIPYIKQSFLPILFELHYDLDENEKDMLQIKYNEIINNNILSVNRNNSRINSIGISYCFNIDENEYEQVLFINELPFLGISENYQLGTAFKITPDITFQRQMSPRRILDPNIFKPSSGPSAQMKILEDFIDELIYFLIGKSKNVFYLSGERGNIPPEISLSHDEIFVEIPELDSTPVWVGHKSQYLLQILADSFTSKPKNAERIREWARRFELGNLRAGYRIGEKLESNFFDTHLMINLNTTLAGLGSRQLLSIITQIFNSNTDDTIMIEEPEISLHPEKQVLLHELFAEAIKYNKQIICTTHSPFFVLSISKIIKKNLLNIDDIIIHAVEKTEEGTLLIELELNKNGFIKNGVPSFMKVESELYQDWLDSLEDEE